MNLSPVPTDKEQTSFIENCRVFLSIYKDMQRKTVYAELPLMPAEMYLLNVNSVFGIYLNAVAQPS